MRERERDARILHGKRLEPGRENNTDWEVPEMDHKRPFHFDVLEDKPFMLTSVEYRIRKQLQVLTTFLIGGGPSWELEKFWTQVGILTGYSAATCDFNWSQEHISVSNWSLSCFVT